MEGLKTDGRRIFGNLKGRGEDGLSRPIKHLSPRDLRILQTLEKYPVLDSSALYAFCGGKSRTRFIERLRLLADPPNEYIAWPPQQRNRPKADRKDYLWTRTRKGRDYLRKRGLALDNPFTEYTTLIEHQYYGYTTLASMELGGAKLEVLHRPPIEVSIAGLNEPFKYMPDMFASITFDEGVGYLIVEVENENSVDRKDLNRASFMRKFLAIRQIVEHKRYKEWDFTNLMALVVSPYPEKIAEMKRVVERETNGAGVPYILFVSITGFDHPWQTFKPRPELYTGVLERTGGYAPFSLSTPPKLKAR